MIRLASGLIFFFVKSEVFVTLRCKGFFLGGSEGEKKTVVIDADTFDWPCTYASHPDESTKNINRKCKHLTVKECWSQIRFPICNNVRLTPKDTSFGMQAHHLQVKKKNGIIRNKREHSAN